MSDARDLSPQEAVDRWLRKRRPELTDESLSTLRYRLKLFVDWCADRKIDSMAAVDGWTVDEYQLDRHEKAKQITLNKEMGTLRQWLDYCEGIGVVTEGVADAVDRPDVDKHQKSRDTKLAAEDALPLIEWYRHGPERATRSHALLEVFWHVGCRVGGMHSLDIRDFDAEARHLQFVHRPETGTTLKKGHGGERYVGLLPAVADVLEEYVTGTRADITDDYGRQPLFPSREGRPRKGTIRAWTWLATVPCHYRDCPHGKRQASCEWFSQSRASNCPSSRAPHHIRTGSITWQRSQGVPAEVVATRVNASVQTIETYYDKEDPEQELERRRRGHLDHLALEDTTNANQ
jgi:site-specific recombinase XerD